MPKKSSFLSSKNAITDHPDTPDSGLRIREIEEKERPREKVLRDPLAVKSLADAELIAILLRTGSTRQNVLELSKALLATYRHDLYALYRDLLSGSCQDHIGLGDVKKVSILAGMELGIRIREQLRSQDGHPTLLTSSEAVYSLVRHHLLGLTEEQMWVIALTSSCSLITIQNVTRGGISEVTADIRTILRHIIRLGAPAFMVLHNHPGGSLQPSRQDDLFTQKLRDASRILNLSLLDHLIVTDRSYYSYHDHDHIL